MAERVVEKGRGEADDAAGVETDVSDGRIDITVTTAIDSEGGVLDDEDFETACLAERAVSEILRNWVERLTFARSLIRKAHFVDPAQS